MQFLAERKEIDEEALGEVEKKIKYYSKYYRQQIEQLKNSPLAKITGNKINEGHIYGLGGQLERWDSIYKHQIRKHLPEYLQKAKKTYKNEAGSTNDLAELPRLAYDLLITNMGASPINAFAGQQSIASSHGDVFVKQITAANTRGNTTSGQIISSPMQAPEVFTDFFIGSANPRVTVATTAGSAPPTGPYAITLPDAPLRKGSVRVLVTTSIYGQDWAQDGYIIGKGLAECTVDYDTGEVVLNFQDDVLPTTTPIYLYYTSNIELSGAYAKIKLGIVKVPVISEPFAVAQELGFIQSWEIEQMLGRLAQDDSMNDLSQCMMAEISNKLINKYLASVVADGSDNKTEWIFETPEGTSDLLYRWTFPFALAEAEQRLYTRTGRAGIDFAIASPMMCQYYQTQDGFESINIKTQGAHIFGKYRNTVIVRAPQFGATSKKMVIGDNGTMMFDKPGVWASYMPIFFLHPSIPVPNNILQVQGGAVTYGAADLVIPRLLSYFEAVEAA